MRFICHQEGTGELGENESFTEFKVKPIYGSTFHNHAIFQHFCL